MRPEIVPDTRPTVIERMDSLTVVQRRSDVP